MNTFKNYCYFSILLFFFCFNSISAKTVDSTQFLVKTKYGLLQGTNENGIYVWKGIRYAKAPVGDLRFKSPQPLENWDGIKQANKYGELAPQIQILGSSEITNEDCLFMNIWSPDTKNKKRPVMFWIHGGGFINGSGSAGVYNGTNLAQKGDVVVVSINYRLGALGFLYFDEINGQNNDFESNLGIKDQTAALNWVKDNIENFGGDPNNITIFGESAGAVSVVTLMNTPSAQGLFQKAIAQSPAINQQWKLKEGTKFTKDFIDKLGITNLSDLKKISTDTLILVASRMIQDPAYKMPGVGTFGPTVDGQFIVSAFDSENSQQNSHIPFLIGTNKDEMNLFTKKVAFIPFTAKPEEVDKVLAPNTDVKEKNKLTSTYKKYPKEQAVTNIVTDGIFRIPCIQTADEYSKSAPTYMYRFDWSSLALNALGYRACHGIEIAFVFNTFDSKVGKKITALSNKNKIYNISDQIQEAWINFARTGNPNGDGGIETWKKYDSTERATMVFNRKTKLICDPDVKQRMAWNGLKFN